MLLVTGGVPSGEDFYEGRRKYVQELKEKVERQEIALIGPRRTGKTSIIKALFEQLEAAEVATAIYINLESCSTPYDIITEIMKKLLEQRTGARAIFSNVVEKANELVGELKGHFDSIDFGTEGGPGIKLKLRHAVEDAKLEALGASFKNLCGTTETKIVIALDELPEAIWKYVNEGPTSDRDQRIKHIGILLSFFRDIRQTNKSSGKLRVIYSGSINFILTLKKLGFAEDHNDLLPFLLPFLNPDESVEMAKELVAGEKILLDNEEVFETTIREQFGFTTPYYIQLYIERLKNNQLSKPGGAKVAMADLVSAYQQILTAEFGPEYFYRRIETYHKQNKENILAILRAMTIKQTEKSEPLTSEDLKSITKNLSVLDTEDLVRSLYIEDFFQMQQEESFEAVMQESSKYYFQSNIIRAYWYKKLKNL